LEQTVQCKVIAHLHSKHGEIKRFKHQIIPHSYKKVFKIIKKIFSHLRRRTNSPWNPRELISIPGRVQGCLRLSKKRSKHYSNP